MKRATFVLVVVLSLPAGAAIAQSKGGTVYPHPTPLGPIEASALTAMPVKEVAVFKDGHAFVRHESDMPTDASGDVILDTLPTPVLGTFWPYSADPAAKLKAVVAGRRRVRSERTAMNVRELLEANPGSEVTITELDGPPYGATVIGLPKQVTDARPPEADSSSEEPQAPRPTPQPPAVPANVVLLKVHDGVRVVSLERIREITFRDDLQGKLATEEWRRLLTLKLDWGDQPASRTARVGMVYLQRGVRWIPNYRVDVDGSGQARFRVQATLINELVDLDDATVHLIIGVPSFAFKDELDPMALQESTVQLSQYFQPGQRLQQAFSNAIMTQQARMQRSEPGGSWQGNPEVDNSPLSNGAKNEDLFVFTLEHVSLRKGERMVVPVVEFTLPYEDVFALDVPLAPPAELRNSPGHERAAEAARFLRAPSVMHRIRLRNSSAYPLTTAPALILRDGRLLAQSLMTYTPVGSSLDLDLTTAVDVPVIKSEQETKRTPNAERWDNESYGRVDLAGLISLTNRRSQSIRVEVKRQVFGTASTADHEGVIERANVLEDSSARLDGAYPSWWSWYDWPYWWYRFNGVGRITWKFSLEPGQSVDLKDVCSHYWR